MCVPLLVQRPVGFQRRKSLNPRKGTTFVDEVKLADREDAGGSKAPEGRWAERSGQKSFREEGA